MNSHLKEAFIVGACYEWLLANFIEECLAPIIGELNRIIGAEVGTRQNTGIMHAQFVWTCHQLCHRDRYGRLLF